MSSDSKYVLCQKCFLWNHDTDIERCILWHIDEQNNPEKVSLRKFLRTEDFSYNGGPVFHPDNKHLIYANYGDLYFYNIATKGQWDTTPYDKNRVLSGLQSISVDENKLMAVCAGRIDRRRRGRSLSDPIDRILFVLENDKFVSQALLPSTNQAGHYFLPIPKRNIIVDPVSTLDILNEEGVKIASYKIKTDHADFVTALATDKYGDYLASGYSDGTIILWDLSIFNKKNPDRRLIGRKLIGSELCIKKLIFTDNQLLLSRSKASFSQKGTSEAILWDMHGNQIINFGNNIHTAKISKNGKKVIIVRSHESSEKTIECYDL